MRNTYTLKTLKIQAIELLAIYQSKNCVIHFNESIGIKGKAMENNV